MKVLITGGAGYLGTELAYRLVVRPDVEKVIIYDNLSRPNYNLFIGIRKFPKGKVRFIKGNLLDTRKLKKSMDGVDVVYHLGAEVKKPFSDHNPQLLEQVNHWGTAEVVYAVEESDVSRLIYGSSAAVYGASKESVNIDTPLTPNTHYGSSKKRGEEHVARIFEKKKVYTVRIANVYGYSKSMRFDARINRYMFLAAAGQKITVDGAGDQVRAYINIDDTTDCLEALLTSNLDSGVYNLVRRNLSVGEIIDGVKEVFSDSEFLYINQHVEGWSLNVEVDERLEECMSGTKRSFLHLINQFKMQFTLNFDN